MRISLISVAYISLNTYTYFEPCMFYSPAVWCSTSSSTCNSLSILCVLHEKRHLLNHFSFTTCFTSMPLFKAFFSNNNSWIICYVDARLFLLSSPFICILQDLFLDFLKWQDKLMLYLCIITQFVYQIKGSWKRMQVQWYIHTTLGRLCLCNDMTVLPFQMSHEVISLGL